MIFQEESAVYSENYTKHIYKLIRKMLRLLLLKQVSLSLTHTHTHTHTQLPLPCEGVKKLTLMCHDWYDVVVVCFSFVATVFNNDLCVS